MVGTTSISFRSQVSRESRLHLFDCRAVGTCLDGKCASSVQLQLSPTLYPGQSCTRVESCASHVVLRAFEETCRALHLPRAHRHRRLILVPFPPAWDIRRALLIVSHPTLCNSDLPFSGGLHTDRLYLASTHRPSSQTILLRFLSVLHLVHSQKERRRPRRL